MKRMAKAWAVGAAIFAATLAGFSGTAGAAPPHSHHGHHGHYSPHHHHHSSSYRAYGHPPARVYSNYGLSYSNGFHYGSYVPQVRFYAPTPTYGGCAPAVPSYSGRGISFYYGF